MEESGGVLTVRMEDVVVEKKDGPTGMQPGDYVQIQVSDTGTGIAPEIVEFIFEPCFTTKGLGKGIGMGLAMAQGVVESYGGGISVNSQLGKGTTFAIYLPVTKSRISQSSSVPVTAKRFLMRPF
jgi:two-component system, cell cycle sensor histidine kinase and response regulator CckA